MQDKTQWLCLYVVHVEADNEADAGRLAFNSMRGHLSKEETSCAIVCCTADSTSGTGLTRIIPSLIRMVVKTAGGSLSAVRDHSVEELMALLQRLGGIAPAGAKAPARGDGKKPWYEEN